MKKFEYIYIRDGKVEPRGRVPHDGSMGKIGAKQVVEFLDKLGDDGWELIDVMRDALCTEFTGILKREKVADGG